MTKRFQYSFITSLFLAILFFTFFYIKYTIDIALFIALPLLVMGFVRSYFRIYNNVTDSKFVYKLSGNQNIIYTDQANHYYKGVSTGGNLYLLHDRLIFQTNAINFANKHETAIFLYEIENISFAKTYGRLLDKDIIINSGKKEERFLVNDRENWKNKIDKAIQDVRSN